MTKITNLIRIINVLYCRGSITINEIMRSCGISKRTVFRYINSISEANIPVFFDNRAKRYQLDRRTNLQIGSLSENDTILIAVAVKLLSLRTDGFYRNELESILDKIFTQQVFSLEKIWTTLEHRIKQNALIKDVSDLISVLTLHSAVILGKRIKIGLTKPLENRQDFEIIRPALKFNHDWKLEWNENESSYSVEIKNIKSAQIL